MKKPILITGMERSGISLISEVVQICGALKGTPNEIRDLLVKPFLRGIKADPNGQSPLPDIEMCKKLADSLKDKWRQRVEDIFSMNGLLNLENNCWFYADPKSVLIWPIWVRAFPEARWIIVRRKDNDIIRSCLKTGYMSAYDDAKGWWGWLETYKRRFSELTENKELSVWQIWPQRMIQGRLAEVKAMIHFLGLEWKEKEMDNFITPILWKEGIFETIVEDSNERSKICQSGQAKGK